MEVQRGCYKNDWQCSQALREGQTVWSQDVIRMHLGSACGSDQSEQSHSSVNFDKTPLNCYKTYKFYNNILIKKLYAYCRARNHNMCKDWPTALIISPLCYELRHCDKIINFKQYYQTKSVMCLKVHSL